MNYSLLKSNFASIDNNSCTVIASSLVFDIDYDTMLKHYDKQGRKRGRGVAPSQTYKINSGLAKELKLATDYTNGKHNIKRRYTNGKTLTVNNASKYLDPSKNYILGVRGHSLAMVSGKIEDHTEGSKREVISVLEVEPTNKVLQPVKVEDNLSTTLAQVNHLLDSLRESINLISK